MIIRSIYISLVVVLFGLGCMPSQHMEWDVRLGKLDNNEDGYHSYYKGLSSKDLKSVCMVLASREEIEGKTIFKTTEEEVIYPSVAYITDLTFVDPKALKLIVDSCKHNQSKYPDTLEIGFFGKWIVDFEKKYIVNEKVPGNAGGVFWGSLTEEGNKQVAKVIHMIRNRAAIEGADRVVDLLVCFKIDTKHKSTNRIFVSGRAVALGKIQEKNSIRSTIQLWTE